MAVSLDNDQTHTCTDFTYKEYFKWKLWVKVLTMADRRPHGWFYQEVPLWSMLQRSRRASEVAMSRRRCPSGLMERRCGTGALLINLRFHAHGRECTHWTVWQIKCAAGCVRAEGTSGMLSQSVSRGAAKSSSATKSATDLISPQMDS